MELAVHPSGTAEHPTVPSDMRPTKYPQKKCLWAQNIPERRGQKIKLRFLYTITPLAESTLTGWGVKSSNFKRLGVLVILTPKFPGKLIIRYLVNLSIVPTRSWILIKIITTLTETVTSIGGNDVFNKNLDIKGSMDTLFELQETLYDRGARNFLFFTIPSLPNASGGRRSLYKDRESRCQAWNQSLKSRIQTEFITGHPDASAFVFDTWELFERLLTNPSEFGFSSNAGRGFDQEMYWDNIHPTSAVHQILAKAVADFLAGEDVGEDKPEKFTIRPRVAATSLEIEF
ncbi:hypothetical protein FRC05_001076 [Tulasnella sp. 425]|nr:hypothetical protein FRC05_001076 [Tulasnella sp. 425]